METTPVLLTPKQEERAFYLRWDEFRNIVEISYSTPDDDPEITVYDVAHTPGPPISGLCCPIQTGERGHEFWTNYAPRKREAIRLGFMRGLCKIIGMIPPISLADWRHVRGDISGPKIFAGYFNPITQRTHQTENYAQGKAEIEALLETIYTAGRLTPFHPNFEQAFFEQLEREPLSNITSFLGGFSTRYGLATPDGRDYLSDLITDAEQTAGLLRPALVERAQTWLRLESVPPQLELTTNDTPAPSSPRPEPLEKSTPPPALLSSADLILGAEFTLDEADLLAHALGLTDEAGNYCLGPRKLGAVVGFALALKTGLKLTAKIPDLTAVLAPRWGVQVATRKTGTGIAEKYFKLTNKALARPKKTD